MSGGSVPGRWLVVSVRPPGDDAAAAEVAGHLMDLGGRAVIEEEGRLVTHLAEPADTGAVSEDLHRRLTPLYGAEGPDVRLGWQPHRDWAELWKRGLAPRRVGSRLVVSPSWCRPDPGSGDLVLVVDPGMAFGTAEHGTTRGCLRLLERAVRPGDRVLDVGAGSGILSIAAARLGAGRVVALEGDTWAVEPARENVVANRVDQVVEVRAAWADAPGLSELGPRDGVVANIETGVLRRLLPGFREVLRPSGWLVLSGVPATEWEVFSAEVLAAGFRAEAVDTDGEWRSGLFRRR